MKAGVRMASVLDQLGCIGNTIELGLNTESMAAPYEAFSWGLGLPTYQVQGNNS